MVVGAGKYSPNRPYGGTDYDYKYTCFGKLPLDWSSEIEATGVVFDSKTMFGNYDQDGFDIYGYSAFDENGKFVGHGEGVDRDSKTESDYFTEYMNSIDDD